MIATATVCRWFQSRRRRSQRATSGQRRPPKEAMSSGSSPARYRCAACGNLTRFDVVVNRRTRSFHHYSLAGELSVENVDVLEESVEEVSCRWCGHGKDIEVVDD